MKVALVHDYLKEYGGAERVLEELHEIFPEAPIFTAYYDPKGLGVHGDRVSRWDIRTSVLQQIPFADKLLSPLRIFAPMIFESFDLKEFDLVISSCSIYFSKAVITKPGSLHISYIHTPPRYLYGYTTSFNYKKNPVINILAEIANHFLRIFDFETSQRPDILVANSKNIQERIKKFYRRESKVIYPPVDIEKIRSFANAQDDERRTRDESKGYFLSLSRLVRGKGINTIILACNQLGLPLKVAGKGPESKRLKNLSGNSIEFLGEVSDEERVKLLANAKALIVASADEDFGITSVESQAAGTPVIAPFSGGYKETIIDGKTGLFYPEVSINSLVEALKKFDGGDFKVQDCQKNAERFSKEKFKQEMLKLVR